MSVVASSAAGVSASLLSSSPSSSRPLPHQNRAYRSLTSPAASRGGSRRRRRLQVHAARTESTGVSVGFRAPQFELPEPLTGRVWTLDDFEVYPALLVMFICNHCPFVKHLKKDIAKLTSFYMEKGLASVAISSNSIVTHPQDGPDCMAEEAKLFKYSFPYLYDEVSPQYVLPDAVSVISPISNSLPCLLFHVTTALAVSKLLRLFKQSAHQSFTCSKRMGEGLLNFSTMGSLMIQDQVAMRQSLEGTLSDP